MAKLRDRKPWPIHVAPLYFDLSEQAGVTFQLLDLCCSVMSENAGVISDLLPTIQRRVAFMDSLCASIRKRIPHRPRGGREPRWANITLDIMASLKIMSELLTIAIDEDEKHNSLAANYAVKKSREKAVAIIHLLDLLPVEQDSPPEAFKDFVESLDVDEL